MIHHLGKLDFNEQQFVYNRPCRHILCASSLGQKEQWPLMWPLHLFLSCLHFLCPYEVILHFHRYGRVSHLPVKRYTSVVVESDERRPALARRSRCSRHLCWVRVRTQLQEGNTRITLGRLAYIYVCVFLCVGVKHVSRVCLHGFPACFPF